MAKDDKATKKAAAKKLADKKAAAKKLADKKAAATKAAAKKLADVKAAAKKVAKKLADKKAAAKKLADKKAAAKKAAKKLADNKFPAKKAKSPKVELTAVPATTDAVTEVAPVVEATEVASSDEGVGPTRREMLKRAGQLGIVGRHRMSKVDLEAAIAAH